MRRPSGSAVALLAVALLAASGFAGVRYASPWLSAAVFLATCLILAVAAVGALCRLSGRRAGWVGFVLFGGTYMATVFGPWTPTPVLKALPTTRAIESLRKRLRVPVALPRPQPSMGGGFFRMAVDPPAGVGGSWWMGEASGRRPGRYRHYSIWLYRTPPAFHVAAHLYHYEDSVLLHGHCLWALLAACVGGATAHRLFARETTVPDRETPTTTNPPPAGRPRRRRGLSVLKLMGVVVLAAAGLAALRNATEAVAGAAFLVAALALALATVGALCRPAGARAGWVGFAVLGWVYMILAFTPLLGQDTAYGELSRRPVLATVPLLELIFVKAPALRGVGSPAQDTSLATLRALAALDRPIPMPFPRETSLADILAYVRRAAAGPDLPDGLPIYVDPNGLQEQDKTMESTATIDLDGVPLRTTLSLVLRQLDLTYTVQDGLVVIYSKTDEEPPFDNPNAFQRIGHCLFALLSGILGGLAGPLVAGRRPGGDS